MVCPSVPLESHTGEEAWGTSGAEKHVLGEDKVTYQVRESAGVWGAGYHQQAGCHGSRTRERDKVRSGRWAGVRRNHECHAETFSPYPTANGMISSLSKSVIQAQHQALWVLQEILSTNSTVLALESDRRVPTAWSLASKHPSVCLRSLSFQRGAPQGHGTMTSSPPP